MKPRRAMIPTVSYCFKEKARGCNVSLADNVPMMMDIHVIFPDRVARLNAAMSFVDRCRPT